MILLLYCCSFAVNLVVKTNFWSKNQLCCFTCNFQTLRVIYMMFWSSMMSYFMTSSENDISNFDIIQSQHSTKVVMFDILLMVDKQALLQI